MSETYNAIYDAARSKMSFFNGGELQEDIVRNFDFSFHAVQIRDDFSYVTSQMVLPSVLYRPSLSIDGNQWCALYGEDLQNGIAGFGDTPSKAMEDFDKQWVEFNVKERK